MRRPLLFVEISLERIIAAYVPSSRTMVKVLSLAGERSLQASGLKYFIHHLKSAPPVVIGLVPRSSVLLTTMTLPTTDCHEARAMALLQFVRTTPHAKEDLIVDAFIIQAEGRGALCSCVMATRQAIEPLLSVLSDAGLVPKLITVLTNDDCPSEWTDGDWCKLAGRFDQRQKFLDLRPDDYRRRENIHILRWRIMHLFIVMIISGIISFVPDAKVYFFKREQLSKLERDLGLLEVRAVQVQKRADRVRLIREHLENRFAMGSMAEAVSESIPDLVRLDEIVVDKTGGIILKGQAPGFSDAEAFRETLLQKNVCADVKIESIEKIILESGEQASFKLFCRKKYEKIL